MISVSDIMVGDYLQNTNGNIGRVIGIQPYNQAPSEIIMSYNGGTCFSDQEMLQPIPLTPKILEKNFGTEIDGMYFDGDEFRELTIREVNDGTWIIKHDCVEFSGIPRQQVMVCYVHELQNAIRLFGTDKDIVI